MNGYRLEALERLLAWAEAGGDESARFNIGVWARRSPDCGTTLCLAGQTAVSAGWVLEWHTYSDGTATASVCSRDGKTRNIEDAAMEELGLSDPETMVLFGLADLTTMDQGLEAVALLRTLVDRARRRLPNMDWAELRNWRRSLEGLAPIA